MLPERFRDLEPWVADWSIAHEAGRFMKRVSAPRASIDAFVAAVAPRLDAIIEHLNRMPTADPDTLARADRLLFDLALMAMEASIPGDLDWDGNDILDAYPPERLQFIEPSLFPEPRNRRG